MCRMNDLLFIAHHAEADQRALPQIMVANFRYGYREPVAHPLQYAFKNTPLFLQGKRVLNNQSDLTDADDHVTEVWWPLPLT